MKDEPTEATVAEDPFPLGSFRDAAVHLRRPFTPEAVKFKPQSATKRGTTLCVAYIDARLVVERLNLVIPDLWSDDYEPLGERHLICRLTIDGIVRRDVGEGAGKALYSDALKRAAVKFGVGVSLYATPTMILPHKVESLWEGSDDYLALRERYRAWLAEHGRKAFGEPLDHGDVEGAAGDPVDGVLADLPAPLVDERAEAQKDEARALYVKLREAAPTSLLPGQFNAYLTRSEHSHERLDDLIGYLNERLEGVNSGA